MKKTYKRFLFNRYTIVILIILAAVTAYFWGRGSKAPVIETAEVAIGNITERVSVTGKILPDSRATLSFSKSGIIATINHKVGEQVKKGDLIASLKTESDMAAVDTARANLAELTRGLRPEEFAADQATLLSASTSLANAKKNVDTAIRDAYVKAQSAIINYADTFFTNPQSANPNINIQTQTPVIQFDINQKRLLVGDALKKWKDLIDVGLITDTRLSLTLVESYLDSMRNFMVSMSNIMNGLNTGSASISQSTINSYIAVTNSGLSSLTQALASVTTADSTLRSAQATFDQAVQQFNLQKAGSSIESIAAAKAKVAAALAELDKDKIYSPIDGLITRADIEIGEFVAAGNPVFSVQSDEVFKIEANVPEADIAKIHIGDKSMITLDAYGQSEIFNAKVSTIDPAETILEGVPTYKVTLLFDNNDDRIRSGMTANTEIITAQKNNVLIVPNRAIVDDNGQKQIRILNADKRTFKILPVSVGLKGSDGQTEVTSGIVVGQKIVTYIK